MAITIRPATASDRDAWFRLWRGYCAFYDVVVADAISQLTWERLLDRDPTMRCYLAVDEDAVLGFANTVLHPITWSSKPVCYLEDLFVDADHRGRGIGRLLIEGLADRGRAEGWHRLYWMTKPENAAARALYDRVVPVTDWLRYDLPL